MIDENFLNRLHKTYALLAEGPHRWVKENFAVDYEGEPVGWMNPLAVGYCITGAFLRFSENKNHINQEFIDLLGVSPIKFNDAVDTTYEDMLAKLRSMIERVEEKLNDS